MKNAWLQKVAEHSFVKKRGPIAAVGKVGAAECTLERDVATIKSAPKFRAEVINEELETAKEELQSTNEELTTLNDELSNRNLEMMQLTGDLDNLLTSVQIPIVMVDRTLMARRRRHAMLSTSCLQISAGASPSSDPTSISPIWKTSCKT